MSTRPTPRTRLDPIAWTDAALRALAAGGIDAIAVEPIAAQLGATKGSFYWHFENRDALISAALQRWEEVATRQVITWLEATPDPLTRLRRLALITTRSPDEDRVEGAILFAPDHRLVTPVVERVMQQRTAFVVDIFRALGYSKTVAQRRAQIMMAAYVGRLRFDKIGVGDSVAPGKGYIRELVHVLTADRPA